MVKAVMSSAGSPHSPRDRSNTTTSASVLEQDIPRMKVSVHLSQPLGIAFQPRPPVDQRALDVLEDVRAQPIELLRVQIEHAHDAFVMADQLARPPDIQRRIGPRIR